MSRGTRTEVLMTGAPEQAEEAINEKIYSIESRLENKYRAEVCDIFT